MKAKELKQGNRKNELITTLTNKKNPFTATKLENGFRSLKMKTKDLVIVTNGQTEATLNSTGLRSTKNIPMQGNDQAYCLMHLEPLLLEVRKFPRFIKGHITWLQVKHCIDKVKANRTYEARMSLYQVQNRLADFASDASQMKGNIGYMRSLLRCFYLMSQAGRPLGHTLAVKTALPFRVDQSGGAA